MYERFTDRARKTMQLANEEAHRLNHEYIGTEHILLGLIKEGSGVAANVLKNLDIDLRRVRLEVERLVQRGRDPATEDVFPKTPRAKKVIEYAMEESRNLGHNYVGTEHILLGLLREEEGVAAQILMNLGLKLGEVRDEVLALLGHGTLDSRDRLSDFRVKIAKEPVAEPPVTCPKCGQSHIVRVLWRWIHLWGQKEEDVRLGKAILGSREGRSGPPWVCLDCSPGWSEVHRLATQEWQWQLAKEEAIAAKDFEKAAWYRDLQGELRQRLSSVVDELLKKQ